MVSWKSVEHPYRVIEDAFWGEWFLHLRQVVVKVHVVRCVDPGGPTVSGKMSFFSALEARPFALRGVIGLGDISVRSLVSSSSLTVSSLVVPLVRWGPSSYRSVHWDRGVVQPGQRIRGVVLPLGVLSLGPRAILPLEEGSVRGPKGVEPSWCILLDGIDKLS